MRRCRMMKGCLIAATLAFALVPLPLMSPASAESVEEFYKSRTVTVLVGQTTGGGYDLNTRLLAQHMGAHLPGKPTMIVQNMPGAGGIKAANFMYSVAPRNGSVISIFPRYLVLEPRFSEQQYDSTKFVWLGSISRDFSTCISWSTSPIARFQDALTMQYTTAGQTAGADSDSFALVIKNLLGAKVRLITGFPGSNEMFLAMERGEVDGLCGASYSTLKSRHASWLTDKKINILLQIALEKAPELPDVPLITELTRDPEKLRILRLVVGTQGMARPFIAPPGTPEDRAVALRAAFDATMKDPAFIADSEKMEADVSPMPGAEIQALVDELYATPKDIVAKAAQAMTQQ